MVMAMLPAAFAADAASGSCGKNVTWSYSDGVLTIEGKGPMDNYAWDLDIGSFSRPWENYCEEIHTVTIGDGVTAIGEHTFDSCGSLTSVTIPNTVTAIGVCAFDNCVSLTDVTIPNSVKSIDNNAFTLCTGLTSVTIPSSVTTIGINAFFGCGNLADIYYGDSESRWKQVSIEQGNEPLFYGKVHYNSTGPAPGEPATPPYRSCGDNLTWSFSDGVLTIEGAGPMYSYSREQLRAPWINYSDYTNPLRTVIIGDGVTTIGDWAFDLHYRWLTSVTIGNSVTTIGKAAFVASGLTSVTIPDSVTIIGDGAFRECKSLTSVTIGNGVTIIDEGAFAADVNLTSINIPVSVTTIGYAAFDGTRLTDVYYGGSESQWKQITFAEFKGDNANAPLLNATIHYNSAPAGTAEPTEPTEPAGPGIPASGTAYPSTQTVELDGKEVEFQMYATKDEKGNDTNYIKIRDLALALNGTKAQFNVDWVNKTISIETGKAYDPIGTENNTPFNDERAYTRTSDPTTLNGVAIELDSIRLMDDNDNGYTYSQVKNLAATLGFNAYWDSARRIICIETDKPYTGN